MIPALIDNFFWSSFYNTDFRMSLTYFNSGVSRGIIKDDNFVAEERGIIEAAFEITIFGGFIAC